MSLDLHYYGISYDYSDFEIQLDLDPDNIYDWLQSSHPKRGDIQITLTSPQGTNSTLLPYRLYDFINVEGYSDWPFMSVHHWGENPVGTWTLHVRFKSLSGYVTMSGLSMTLYGTTTTPQAVANIPGQCDPACQGACSGPGPENCDICRELRVAETLECVSSCPNDTSLYKSYCIMGTARHNPTTQHPLKGSPTHHPIFSPSSPSSPDDGADSSTKIAIGVTIGGVMGAVFIAIVVGIFLSLRNRKGTIQFQRLPTSDSDSRPVAV